MNAVQTELDMEARLKLNFNASLEWINHQYCPDERNLKTYDDIIHFFMHNPWLNFVNLEIKFSTGLSCERELILDFELSEIRMKRGTKNY